MDMEVVCAKLKTPELWVHSPYIAKTKSIKHEIRRKTFIPWVPCDVCGNPIWLSGWRCELCLIKFHAKCSYRAPLYCDLLPTFMHDEEVFTLKFFGTQNFLETSRIGVNNRWSNGRNTWTISPESKSGIT